MRLVAIMEFVKMVQIGFKRSLGGCISGRVVLRRGLSR